MLPGRAVKSSGRRVPGTGPEITVIQAKKHDVHWSLPDRDCLRVSRGLRPGPATAPALYLEPGLSARSDLLALFNDERLVSFRAEFEEFG